jgi:hypothetical protein
VYFVGQKSFKMPLIFTKDFMYGFSNGSGMASTRNTSENTHVAKSHTGTYRILRDTLCLPKVHVAVEQLPFGKVDALNSERRSLTCKSAQYLHKAW